MNDRRGKYMLNTEELVTTLKVVKRNGKKVDFDGTKIALAIKKGFDSIVSDDELVYTSKDVTKVYQTVIKKKSTRVFRAQHLKPES